MPLSKSKAPTAATKQQARRLGIALSHNGQRRTQEQLATAIRYKNNKKKKN